MKEQTTEFGKEIRAARVRAGLSQKELAEKTRLGIMTIRRAEASKTVVEVSKKTLEAIAEVLNAPSLLQLFTPVDSEKLREALQDAHAKLLQKEQEKNETELRHLKLTQKVLALKSGTDIDTLTNIVDAMLFRQEVARNEEEERPES